MEKKKTQKGGKEKIVICYRDRPACMNLCKIPCKHKHVWQNKSDSESHEAQLLSYL